MNNISARDSLPGRCLVCSDGINRWASQSAKALQKSSRQQYSAVISTAIEGTLRNRVCGSVFANRSCQTFDSFGIPSTLIRSSGYIDVHLLAAVRLTPGAALWTNDKRLRAVVSGLGLAMKTV